MRAQSTRPALRLSGRPTRLIIMTSGFLLLLTFLFHFQNNGQHPPSKVSFHCNELPSMSFLPPCSVSLFCVSVLRSRRSCHKVAVDCPPPLLSPLLSGSHHRLRIGRQAHSSLPRGAHPSLRMVALRRKASLRPWDSTPFLTPEEAFS